MTIEPPCLCYSCACYTYKGCPFSGTMIWPCGKNVMQGPCIGMSFASKDTIYSTWMGFPADEFIRKGGAPTTGEMER